MIRLNKVTLNPVKGKDYARLMFSGDWHLGHPQCLIGKIQEYLDWALLNQCYVILMGDLIESGLTTSIGDSVYQQTLNPDKQMESVVEMLEPLAQKGLIIGLHGGNHCARITKTTSIDVAKIMAKQLAVPYLGFAGWNLLRVGKQSYTMYSCHGSGGARFVYTKLAKLMQLTAFINADCVAMGHVHSLGTEVVIKQAVNLRNKTVEDKECRVIMTGSFLSWDRSYAQSANMPITKIGSPVMKLMANRPNLAVSI